MEYYDEVVEIDDRTANNKPIGESIGIIGNPMPDDENLDKTAVNPENSFKRVTFLPSE